ncbi:MAG: TatD family hydrolase [Candidatus Aminicenantales bacterium]
MTGLEKREKDSPDEKPGLVDSHAHLDMEDFDADREETIRRAFDAGIRSILCPADLTSPQSLQTTLELSARNPNIRAAAGIHPHQAKFFKPETLLQARELVSSKKISALGEIGLDYHYDFSPPEAQRNAFRAQLNLAQELSLPVIIHSRKAGPEVAAAVKGEGLTRGGILHCFTEDWNLARAMLDCGFFISFSGILTYPGAQSLRDIARKIPLERLLVETDSPYLVPSPFRGTQKRNEPAFVVATAKVLADLKKIAFEELAGVTSHNFYSLFSK